MDKPATLLQREFQKKIVDAINESGLPAFVLVPILEQALAEVQRIEEQQYQEDKKKFESEEARENGKIT